MNWKLEAAKLLKNYEAMAAAVQNLPQQIRLLEAAARMLRGSQGQTGPVCGGGSREDWLLTNLTKRQALQQQLELAGQWLQVIHRALATLSREDRELLQVFFIDSQREKVQQLCHRMHLERSSVYRKRDRALERFATALYGSVEGGRCA